MATRNNATSLKNIVFNVSGYDPILDLQKKTLKNIQQRKKEQEALLAMLKKEDEAYKTVAATVQKLAVEEEKASKVLQKYKDDFSEATQFVKQFDTEGPKGLAKGIKAVEKMIKNMSLAKYDLNTKQKTLMDPEQIKKLEAAVALLDMAKARQYSMQKGVVDLTKALKDEERGWSELNNAVDVYEKKGRDLARMNKDEQKAFEEMGRAATAAKVRMAEMDGTIVKLRSGASKEALEGMAKFFRDIQKYAGASEAQIKQFKQKYDATQRELAQKHKEIVAPETGSRFSMGEQEQSLAWLKAYREEVAGNAKAEQELTTKIKEGEEALRLRKEQAALPYFTQQYAQLTQISRDALREQVKYWQEVAESATNGSAKYEDATAKVRALNEELTKRRNAEISAQGNAVLSNFVGKDGAFTGWGDADKQSIQTLEKMKRALIEYKEVMDTTSSDGATKLQSVNSAIQQIDKSQAEVNAKTIKWDEFMKKVGDRKASLVELEDAYRKVRGQLEHMGKADPKWNEKITQLKELKKAITDMNESLGYQDGAFKRLTGRLVKYITTFVGFNSVALTIKSMIPAITALSDQMTTLEKVSGLTADETDRVVKSLQSWDVRGTTEELMDLAVQAGKLGVAARGGADAVTQFVKAGQMVISTLGDDIGGAQAVSDLLKVNDLVNKTGESIEQSMNRIGSSILVVGNNSTASYANITEFVGRLGAVGEAAHLSMSEIVGLGGTLDALKQPIEASSTAMGKLLVGMQVNAAGLAEKAKVSVKEMQDLLAAGKTIEALFLLLKGVQDQGLGIAPIRDLLREIGGRYSQNLLSTFAVLMNNMPMLQKQLNLAERGYEDATQMAYEFEKANNNAAGSAKRLGNSLKELVVNDTTVAFFKMLTEIIRPLVDMIVWLEKTFGLLRGTLAFFAGKYIQAGIISLYTNLMHLKNAADGNVIAMGRLKLAVIGLTTFLKANALGILLTVVSVVWQFAQRASDARKALGAMEEEMNNAVTSADAMFNRLVNINKALKNSNLSEEEAKNLLKEKSRLIGQINEKYSTYLGFMISEADAANTVAMAHQLVISKLREEYALKMQNQAVEQASETYKDDRNKYIGQLRSSLEGQIGSGEAGEAMSVVAKVIAELVAADVSTEYIVSEVNRRLGQRWEKADLSKNRSLKNLIETEQKIKKATEDNVNYFKGQEVGQQAATADSAKSLAGELYREVAELEKKTDKTSQDKARLVELAQRIQSLGETIEQNGGTVQQEWKDNMARIIQQYGQSSIWGKDSGPIQSWSVNKLVATFKELNEAHKDVTTSMTAENFRQVFPNLYDHEIMKDFDDQAMRDWLRSKIDELHEEFERRRLTTEGNPKWNNGGNGGYAKTMKDEMDMALKRLEEYYNRRRGVIESYLAEEQITEEEYNRRMSQEERDYLTDRSRLREQWMGKEVTYIHDEDVKKIMEGVKFEKIAEYLATEGKNGGKHLVDGIKAAIEKDRWDVQKELSKLVATRKAAMLDYMPMDKALDDFRKSLEELDLLYGEKISLEERREKGSGERRMAILYSYIAKVDGMTKEQFATELKMNEEYSQMTEEETALLYERLLQLREEYETAARRMAMKETRALKNQVESGEWYEEQLAKYRRYLQEMERTGASAEKVKAGQTLVGYMQVRQNTPDGVSYAQREKQRTEALKTQLKHEQQLKEQDVQNDVRIAKLEAQISAREIKAASEALFIRKAQYGAKVKVLEDAIRKEKKAIETETLTDEERAKRMVYVGMLETDLMVTRQQNAEVIKDLDEKLLAAETEFTQKEMALFAERQTKIREFSAGLQEAWNNWTTAAANARGETAASIALAEYQENLARAEMSAEELASTANEDLPDALKKTHYAIYNSKGVIEDVWLTPLEKLQKEQEIAVKNAKALAQNEYIDKLSEKLNESIDDALKRATTEQELQNSEARKAAIVEEMQRGSLAIQIANEKEATDAIYAYKIQKEQEYQAMRAQMSSSENATGVQENTSGTDSLLEQTHNIMMQNLQTESDMVNQVEHGKQSAIQQTGKVEQNVSKQTVRTEQQGTQQKADLTKTMAASMIQSMNLYGIAYNTVSNENLSASEKTNAIILQTTGTMINTVLSVLMQEAIANIIAGKAMMIGKAFAINPYLAAGIIAVGSAALGVAMASMKSSVSSAQTEIASLTEGETSSSASKASAGRLKSGMLTYAEGNVEGVLGGESGGRVNVHGADGKDYNAKVKPALTTGVYSSPHVGIVGEDGAELIVDHPTLSVLRKDSPETLRAIYNAHMFGRTMLDYDGLNRSARMLGRTGARGRARNAGLRTYADGNVEDVLNGMGSSENMEGLNGVLVQLTEVLTLMQTEGVRTDFHFGGRDGFSREDKKFNSWQKRHGLG